MSFKKHMDKFMTVSDVPHKEIRLRVAATLDTWPKRAFLRCGCKTHYSNKKCNWVNLEKLCNSQCQFSLVAEINRVGDSVVTRLDETEKMAIENETRQSSRNAKYTSFRDETPSGQYTVYIFEMRQTKSRLIGNTSWR